MSYPSSSILPGSSRQSPLAHLLTRPEPPILLAFLLLAALIWTAVLQQTAADRAKSEADLQKDVSNLARMFAAHVARTLRGVDQATLLVKTAFERDGPSSLATLLERSHVDTSLFNQIGVIDRHGMYRHSNLPDPRPIDLSDREHFRVHAEGRSLGLFVSKPVVGRASGKPSIQVTRRLERPDGAFDGVVVASMDPQYFSRMLKDLDLGLGGAAELVGSDGVVRIRQSGANGRAGQDIAASRLFRLASRQSAGSVLDVSAVDGVSRFVGFREVEGFPLFVTVGLAESDALAAFAERRRGYLIWGAVATVALLGAALLLLVLTRRIDATRARAESSARAGAALLRTTAEESLTAIRLLDRRLEDTGPVIAGMPPARAGELRDILRRLVARLDAVHLAAGGMSFTASPLIRSERLAPLLARAAGQSAAAARARGLGIAVEMDADAPEMLPCDRRRFLRLLGLMFDEAIETARGGSIRLVAQRTRAGLRLRMQSRAGSTPLSATGTARLALGDLLAGQMDMRLARTAPEQEHAVLALVWPARGAAVESAP